MEEIKRKAQNLKNRVAGINNWIQEHQEVTEPNMYEYTQVLVEFGEILSEADEYYKKHGYPENIDAQSGHYEISHKVAEFNEVNEEIKKLVNLRNLNNIQDNPDIIFTSVPEVRDFLTELEYRTYTADYKIPNDLEIAKIKKEILCKCMGIAFYIWNTQRKEPEYIYDNKNEYEMLQGMYNTYSASEGIQVVKHDAEGNTYEGPQFGDVIENIMKYINKNYIYAAEDTNVSSKTI